MIRSSQSMTAFIKSIAFEDQFENKNINKGGKIYENVRISDNQIVYSKKMT